MFLNKIQTSSSQPPLITRYLFKKPLMDYSSHEARTAGRGAETRGICCRSQRVHRFRLSDNFKITWNIKIVEDLDRKIGKSIGTSSKM